MSHRSYAEAVTSFLPSSSSQSSRIKAAPPYTFKFVSALNDIGKIRELLATWRTSSVSPVHIAHHSNRPSDVLVCLATENSSPQLVPSTTELILLEPARHAVPAKVHVCVGSVTIRVVPVDHPRQVCIKSADIAAANAAVALLQSSGVVDGSAPSLRHPLPRFEVVSSHSVKEGVGNDDDLDSDDDSVNDQDSDDDGWSEDGHSLASTDSSLSSSSHAERSSPCRIDHSTCNVQRRTILMDNLWC